MPTTYFDLTDTLQFFEKNLRVTGMQRVQLQIVADIVRRHGAHDLKGLAYFGDQQGWRSMDLSFLANLKEFDATQILIETGKLTASRFPPNNQIRKLIAPYHDRKLQRSLLKAGIYLQALLWPKRLQARTGLTIWKDLKPRPTLPCPSLGRDDLFVLLTPSWDRPEVAQFARAHHEGGGHVLMMMHDLIPSTHPGLHSDDIGAKFRAWLEDTPEYVNEYLCVSDNTATELRKFLSRKNRQTHITVHPLAHEFAGYPRNAQPGPHSLASRAHGIAGEYVLCVGSIEIRKNGLALLNVWERIKSRLGEATPTLVFAGKLAWRSADFVKKLRDSGHLGGSVRILDSPTDAELADLYGRCLFTVYPSLQEGWGLPVGESAWFGKFIVASSASSVPEVCGPLIDYVNPTDLDDMTAKMLRPILDRTYLAQRTEALRCAPLRMWQQVAEGIYADIVKYRN